MGETKMTAYAALEQAAAKEQSTGGETKGTAGQHADPHDSWNGGQNVGQHAGQNAGQNVGQSTGQIAGQSVGPEAKKHGAEIAGRPETLRRGAELTNRRTGDGSGQPQGKHTPDGTAGVGQTAPTDGESVQAKRNVTRSGGASDGQSGGHADGQPGGGAGQSSAPRGGEKQDAETNAEFARRRREEERKQELEAARAAARTEVMVEIFNGVNPLDGSPMQTAADVARYEQMKREAQAKQGMKTAGAPAVPSAGRGLSDPSGAAEVPGMAGSADLTAAPGLTAGAGAMDVGAVNAQTAARNTAWEQAQEDARRDALAEDRAYMERDIAAFRLRYPLVSIETLANDREFSEYADGKLGRRPLADIYESYTGLITASRRRYEAEIAQKRANAASTPGGLSFAGRTEKAFYTKAEVSAMSEKEIEHNLEKIQKSMMHWQ